MDQLGIFNAGLSLGLLRVSQGQLALLNLLVRIVQDFNESAQILLS